MNILQEINYLIELNLNRTLGKSRSSMTKEALQAARRYGKMGFKDHKDFVNSFKSFDSPVRDTLNFTSKNLLKRALIQRHNFINNMKDLA